MKSNNHSSPISVGVTPFSVFTVFVMGRNAIGRQHVLTAASYVDQAEADAEAARIAHEHLHHASATAVWLLEARCAGHDREDDLPSTPWCLRVRGYHDLEALRDLEALTDWLSVAQWQEVA